MLSECCVQMEALRLADLKKGGARTIKKQQEWAELEEEDALEDKSNFILLYISSTTSC